jgi:hypothetical protein
VTTIIDRTMRAAPHRAVSTRVVAPLLVALMALLLTGCRDSPTAADPIPWPAPSNQYAPLDDPSGYPDEYGEYTDEPGTTHGDDPGGYTDDPGGYPDGPGDYTGDAGSDTNPCAFPGDPLCPDTPITVPPPNLNPPW